jgi:D-methionine transport system ATP-binding protein
LEKPTSGHVYVDQIDLTMLSTTELKQQRQNIGMIFQHFNLLKSRTAFENIALPLELLGKPKKQIKHDVSSLLELIKLEQYKNHYPEQLSGGQQQRVAIARALATKPHILLCDEPTSALDPRSTASILKLLKEINHKLGVTILLITHEMDVIKQICHHAGVLDHGTLIEHGSIIELFSKPKSEITKQLVQKALHIELPRIIRKNLQLKAENGKSCLVRFTFVGDDSNQPLITTLVQKFNLTINIIQANIENIQEATVGFTICLLSGEQGAIHNALAYVKPSSITAEVLGYV